MKKMIVKIKAYDESSDMFVSECSGHSVIAPYLIEIPATLMPYIATELCDPEDLPYGLVGKKFVMQVKRPT